LAGIYIHIPFCKQACSYCNFYFSTNTSLLNNAIQAINAELVLRANELNNQLIETIYFGGGTPSLATVQHLQSIIITIKNNYQVAPYAEISLELNPDDINLPLLENYLALGINRLSVGIQSFNNQILKLMNRVHNADKALQCLKDIKTAGFTNYSADLIYGNPNQTLEQWEADVNQLLLFSPPHISAYALTVEPKTALQNWINTKKINAPLPELQSNMYSLLQQKLQLQNYQHYEISNWATNGYHSKHNSSYWQGKTYLGIGPSAHSFNGLSRKWNISHTQKYIQGINLKQPNFESEILSPENIFNEHIMINLRLSKGLDFDFMLANFNAAWCNKAYKILQQQKYQSLVTIKNNKVILTNNGKFFADGIAADCFV
jgi:oxygen-independent coproporphyrinogen III oxidase